MYKILMVCAAGLSTSLVMSKMKKAAEEKGIAVKIDAIPVENFVTKVKEYDIVLLGPQVRFKQAEFQKIADQYGKKVKVINSLDYGMLRGEKILEETLAEL